jgi:sugar O-acyltransferase (sialic acid O-acetyltransferase NeuD family)
MRPAVLWGSTGQAKVLRECCRLLGYEIQAVFDNAPDAKSPFSDVPLFVGEEGFRNWLACGNTSGTACLSAIGGARGRDRLRMQDRMVGAGLTPITVVHPSGYVAADCRLGSGCQVLAQATICTEAVLGRGCIINTKASVDHECTLGDGVHVAPGATLAGCVVVGDCTLIAVGAVILPRVRIGRDVIVGAGSVVTKDVPDGKIVFGNPARVRGENSQIERE